MGPGHGGQLRQLLEIRPADAVKAALAAARVTEHLAEDGRGGPRRRRSLVVGHRGERTAANDVAACPAAGVATQGALLVEAFEGHARTLAHHRELTGSAEIKKVRFYIAQYPVHWTAQISYTLPPGSPVHSDTNSASLGSILARQQLRAKTKSLMFPIPSMARYSFIQLGKLRRHGERKCPNFEPGLSRLRVRHSTTELLHSTNTRRERLSVILAKVTNQSK